MYLSAATAEEVFKGVNDTLNQEADPTTLILIFVSIAVLIIIFALVNRRTTPQTQKAKVLHNQARLIKQIAKQVGIKPRELKQLRALAEQEELENPLVLLLCPSVLQAAMKRRQWTQK